MTEPVAQVSRTIAASPDRVWKALTSEEEASTYFMGARVRSHFAVGSPITFEGVHEGKAYADKGEILEARPGRRLKMSHFSPLTGAEDQPENYNTVTFDLEPDGDRTRVTLTQAHLQGEVSDADRENREKFEANWAGVLDGLDRAVRS